MKSVVRAKQSLLLVGLLLAFSPSLLMAVVTGSISGTVRDSSGAVIPDVSVEARNTNTGVAQTIQSDSVGFYNFPALAVGQYDVSFQKSGFVTYRQTGLVIDVDTALRVDAVLQVGLQKQEVTVIAAAAQVDTRTQQTGEVISGTEMEDLPLNGRAYTDLLALQPGVVPFNLSQYGTLSPSNSLNNGVLVMSGQRDVQNGFMVNGANTVEGNEGGTTVIPNLDSIAEFRIILSNAGAE
ncbi:MAG: TonB-dependent receptor, partial [Acidobacteria bacterium]